eukprot:1162025-Pelagomonas_calceolata.AAC.9
MYGLAAMLEENLPLLWITARCLHDGHNGPALWAHNGLVFAQEENLPLFVDYCTLVFQHYGHRIRLWATMNEPTVSESLI